jgi:hypothetical protein
MDRARSRRTPAGTSEQATSKVYTATLTYRCCYFAMPHTPSFVQPTSRALVSVVVCCWHVKNRPRHACMTQTPDPELGHTCWLRRGRRMRSAARTSSRPSCTCATWWAGPRAASRGRRPSLPPPSKTSCTRTSAPSSPLGSCAALREVGSSTGAAASRGQQAQLTHGCSLSPTLKDAGRCQVYPCQRACCTSKRLPAAL